MNLRKIGRLKFVFERVRGYWTIPSSLLIPIMFCKQYELSYWWIVLVFGATLFIAVIDIRHFWGGEQEIAAKYNPVWQKFQKDIDHIKDLLEKRDK